MIERQAARHRCGDVDQLQPAATRRGKRVRRRHGVRWSRSTKFRSARMRANLQGQLQPPNHLKARVTGPVAAGIEASLSLDLGGWIFDSSGRSVFKHFFASRPRSKRAGIFRRRVVVAAAAGSAGLRGRVALFADPRYLVGASPSDGDGGRRRMAGRDVLDARPLRAGTVPGRPARRQIDHGHRGQRARPTEMPHCEGNVRMPRARFLIGDCLEYLRTTDLLVRCGDRLRLPLPPDHPVELWSCSPPVRVALPLGRCITIRNSSRRNRCRAKFSKRCSASTGASSTGAPFKLGPSLDWKGFCGGASSTATGWKRTRISARCAVGFHDFRTEMHPNIRQRPDARGAKTVTPPPNRHLTSLSARAIVLAVHPPMTLFARTILITAALVALTAGAAESQVALPKSSPFMPPGSAAAGVTAANETLEFAGVSVPAKDRSHFLRQGGQEDTGSGSARPRRHPVLNTTRPRTGVVKINGRENPSLRKGAGRSTRRVTSPQMHHRLQRRSRATGPW